MYAFYLQSNYFKMNNYTSIFHVGILDDLHNYFPDLLYNSGRFNSVQSVLQYIQSQARTRCNPFEQGLHQYNNQNNYQRYQNNIVVNPPSVQIPVVDTSGSTVHPNYTTSNIGPATPPVRPRLRVPAAPPPVRRSNAYTTLLYPDYNETYIDGIHGLASLFNIALNPSNMIDVPVIPTNQQIDRATTVLTAHTIREPCAICQEGIDASSPVRRINRCQHAFHQTCIDPWFQTSVTCPICRTDIRATNDE